MLLEFIKLSSKTDADVTYTNVLPEKVGHLVSCVSSPFTFEAFYDASSTSFRSCNIGTNIRVAMQTFSNKA